MTAGDTLSGTAGEQKRNFLQKTLFRRHVRGNHGGQGFHPTHGWHRFDGGVDATRFFQIIGDDGDELIGVRRTLLHVAQNPKRFAFRRK